jgi:hypothetical protein
MSPSTSSGGTSAFPPVICLIDTLLREEEFVAGRTGLPDRRPRTVLLLAAKEERLLLRTRGQLAKLDLLILDELGYVPASKAGAELLFDVIATAYERNSVLVTTNLPFENWTEVLGNERLTGAALDRLTHRCHILETKGESYRLKEAKRRRGGR